jgi:hypothetical protein
MDWVYAVYNLAFLDHCAAIAETLEPLELLACHRLPAYHPLPRVRRYPTDISPMARDLVLAYYRRRGWDIRWYFGVVVSREALKIEGRRRVLTGQAF